jgi:hypothetical protein
METMREVASRSDQIVQVRRMNLGVIDGVNRAEQAHREVTIDP